MASFRETPGRTARAPPSPMTEPAIRPATEGDWPAIESMAEEVVRSGEMFVYESVAEVMTYWIGSPHARVFVALVDGEVAGTYVVKPNQPGRGSHVANAGYMTLEHFRGRGIGLAMGEHSIATARALGYSAMQFNFVVATNESAVRLWGSLGFETVGRIPAGFRRPNGELADALVMWRELATAPGAREAALAPRIEH